MLFRCNGWTHANIAPVVPSTTTCVHHNVRYIASGPTKQWDVEKRAERNSPVEAAIPVGGVTLSVLNGRNLSRDCAYPNIE